MGYKKLRSQGGISEYLKIKAIRLQRYIHKLTAAVPPKEIKKLEDEGWKAVSTILDEDETIGGIYWEKQK